MSGAKPGIFGLDQTAEQARVVLIAVPWEPTTSYHRGTAKGPMAILRASQQVDLYDRQTGNPSEHGIALLDVDRDIVEWNEEACGLALRVVSQHDVEALVTRVNQLSAQLNARLTEVVQTWLSRGKIVGTLGGDHSAVFGAIAAHAERYPNMGIFHIDAHADLRQAYQGFTDSHASILYNVLTRLPQIRKIVQVGLRDVCEEELDRMQKEQGRIVSYFDSDMADRLFDGEPFHRIADQVIQDLPQEVYVTFDIDGLDPTLCPHTGTPVPGGLSFQQATALLKRVKQSGRTIVGFDLNEVVEGPNGNDWDENVGARVLYKLIGSAL